MTESSKIYQKYKLIVKAWEKQFIKEKCRVPSKHDIKEAPIKVRTAYKHYVKLKSEILETSLMDMQFDEDDSPFDNVNSPNFFDNVDLDSEIGMNIPSTDDIEKFMNVIHTNDKSKLSESSTDAKISAKVWGSHLNNKPKEIKTVLSNNAFSRQDFTSTELFKSCSFKKRNPRKSISSLNVKPPVEFAKSENSQDQTKEIKIDESKKKSDSFENVETDNVSVNELSEIQIDKINEKTEIDIIIQPKSCLDSSYCINPIKTVMSNSSMPTRNINARWISRCDTTELMTNLSDEKNVVSESNISNHNILETSQKSNCYGLKNITVYSQPLLEDSHFSDFVENSESEAEQSQNNYKKIRPVVKKCKLDINNLGQLTERSQSIPEESNKTNYEIMDQKESKPKKTKGRVTKKTNSATTKAANTKGAKASLQKNTRRSVRKKYQKPDTYISSESEHEERPVRRGNKKQNKKNIITYEEDVAEDYPNMELENDFTGEIISYPRFPISSSILKENNLVEGFTAAIKIPKELKESLPKKSSKKMLSEEEKLQKKIDDGCLNENFVRINLEKKVYVRGKKTMNFSKFKKQQWKNKKKMLHQAPEFPEGGVLKCFKCGQPGHMARYCTAGRGGNLLPLSESHESSSLISIHEADNLKNIEEAETVRNNIQFECINKLETELGKDEMSNDVVDKSLKAIHPIPETFIKLLNSTSVSSSFTQDYIEPVYQLGEDGSLIDTPTEVKEALNLFGHESFRSGQEIAVMRILSGLSTLVTLSTGSGKSLCYQLPAYLYAKHNKCITLVISPLVSLMEDQVTNMPSFVHAACLHTNQPPSQREKIMDLIRKGNVHILLISPEAIVAGEKSTGFGAILKQLPPIAFACIDEVHCVSQWSHNFRPSYLMICRVLREKLRVKCVLGLTATATKPTMLEIVQHLQIHDGIDGIITNKPLPDNLVLTVSRDPQRDHSLLELLVTERFSKCDSIIIYCIRRDECERVAGLIRSSMQHSEPKTIINNASKKRKRFNWVVEAYHAGMSAAKRRKVQQAFMSGELRIVVATVAFGMGIDKSNIRGVIHYNMPSSFESYVQEVGRAGRDGLPAQCHTFIDREFRDKNELLRHIHANSIERHVIRKLLQRVFVPCGCSKMLMNMKSDENTEVKCQGHEVAFSVDETVSALDLPSENISTLLCYLELHPKKFAKNLSNVYIMCKIISYGGPTALLKAAEKCPPLAMAIALEKKKGDLDNSGTMEFCVIEVAAAIGWESGVVKYHLKNLEWEKRNGLPKKSLLRVEFNTLGFRVKSPGDLTSSELDAALDTLYERSQLQEKSMLCQLQQVSKTLSKVSFPTIIQCSSSNTELFSDQSNQLKEVIRNYFSHETSMQEELELDERPINKDHVIADVRGLVSTYRDCTFTGRAVARIFQGISSPNFPAIVWGRCRYWRSHISEDFYKLVNIATQQIISLR